MKDVKERAHNLKANHHKTNKSMKDKQEKVETVKGYNKRNTRYMTKSKINDKRQARK